MAKDDRLFSGLLSESRSHAHRMEAFLSGAKRFFDTLYGFCRLQIMLFCFPNKLMLRGVTRCTHGPVHVPEVTFHIDEFQ